jgi:hypothetical protein
MPHDERADAPVTGPKARRKSGGLATGRLPVGCRKGNVSGLGRKLEVIWVPDMFIF